MWRLILRRLLVAVPLLFVVSALTFTLTSLAPGNAAETVLGSSASRAQVAALERKMGLDQPLWEQYWHWFEKAVTGDLGTSLVSSQSVGAAVSARLPVTLSLVITATVVSAVLGVGMGMVSALRGACWAA